MKKLLFMAFIAVFALQACKTSEANYRAAYEAAKAKQADDGGVDSTVYAAIKREAVPEVATADGDSVRMKTEFVKVTEGPDTMPVFAYGVVVGQFRQVFNARAMRARLIGQGYAGALVLETREPLYYVVAVQAATLDAASVELRKISGDKQLVLREPLPWILKAAGRR